MVYEYINSTGTIIPDTSEILSDVQTTYKEVFSTDLVVTADTPQGVLITAEALTETATVNNNAALANQINPNLAGGIFLDAIMALTFPQGREAAEPTLVSNVDLTGVAGTIISAGSQAKTAAGDIFQTLTGVTLDSLGAGVVNFASVDSGAIPCAAHALDTIVTNVIGWETVDNSTAGVLGTSTQSDQATEALRSNTLAFQGVALAVAITSTLYAVSGVESLTFRENYESVPAGAIVSITSGATLAGTIWGMTTSGNIVVGTNSMAFALTSQVVPDINPWPVAKYTTTANITLSGLSTQGGGDWAGSLTAGDIILVKNQSTPSQNGIWVAAAGAWARQSYNAAGTTILGSLSGISLKSNSIYTCIESGSDLELAAGLLENKSSGCGWNGNTQINVIEPASGQNYLVQFDRPAEIGILIRVTTTNSSVDNIKNVIVDYANGLISGLEGFVVGSDVSPFEISGAIMSVYPNYYISKVEISFLSPIVYTTDLLAIALNEIARTQTSYITVVIA